MTDSPRVFISYARSEKQTPAVRALADRLRSDGVDAWIDEYEEAPPAGWRMWMEDQLRRADFVLIVASARYTDRLESDQPIDDARGSRYEGILILDDLYEAGMWNVRYVPVVLLEQDKEHVPAALRSYQRFSLYHPGGYERLLRLLTGQPEIVALPLGERRHLPPREGYRSQEMGPGPGPGDPGPGEPAFSKSSGRGDGELTVTEPVPPEDRPNPFDPWTPAVPPRFVGRASELRRLERSLETGFGVSIVGDSRIGKSSLLRTFQGRLAAAGRTVRYLDGQGSEGQSIAAFVAKVVRKPASQVPEDSDGAADALGAWIAGRSNGLRPVLLVDEIDGLPGKFDLRFFERLRNLIGRLVLVVASRKEVDRLYDEIGKTSPFDNRLQLVRIGLSKREDADGVIGLGKGLLQEGDATELRRWAGRHPHFLQLYAFFLLEGRAHREESESKDRFLDNAARVFRALWKQLNTKEQAHLHALVKGQAPRPPRTLTCRGILEEDGRPFGEVLETWLREEL